MFRALIPALAQRRAPPTAAHRLEVCPPLAFTPSRLGRWLRRADVPGAERRALDEIRLEFCQCLHDVDAEDADDLMQRIRYAGSLRELWHLRAELFSVVARCHMQSEAGRRLTMLNRHFPTRSARSGFAPLE